MNINIHNIYRPFLRYFRVKRMKTFQKQFNISSKDRILDVGGTPFNWSLITEEPKLFLVNLTIPKQRENPRIIWIVADGCHLPFKKNSFDIAYSNSVIEHLGNIKNQKLFANEFKRIAKRHYLQTPNRTFFFEPHYLTPFIHWLPPTWRKKLMKNFTVRGWITRPSAEQCSSFVDEINLLSHSEMTQLFPDTEIWTEKFLLWVKSFVVVKK